MYLHKMFSIFMLLGIWRFVSEAVDVPSCGSLDVSFVCHNQHVDAKFHLDSSDAYRACISTVKLIRWYLYPEHSTSPKPLEDAKHEKSNLTFTVHNFDKSDEGSYRLECVSKPTICVTDSSKVKLPVNKECDIHSSEATEESHVTTQSTAASPLTTQTNQVQAPSSGVVITNTVIAVIAVCAVIIVIVIAGTIVIVVHKGTTKSTRHHESYDGGSTIQLHQEESTVYNSTDHVLENGEANNLGFSSSKLSLISLATSPPLPKRPKQGKPIKEEENDYDLIRDSLINDKDGTNRIKVETKVAVVEMEMNVSSRDDGYTTISASGNLIKDGRKSVSINNNNTIPEYSKVIKRKKEFCAGEHLETSTSVDTNPITLNNNTIPEYAKVIKRKKETNVEEQLENCKCANNNFADYQIKFPYINCSEIVQTLPNDIQKYDDTASGEPVHYCNTEQKRRQSRASRKSLQYAILDHSGSIPNLDALSYGAYDLPDFITCQYASIDFDKKAFIAPVRRPPSSWYKRHNKRNNKT